VVKAKARAGAAFLATVALPRLAMACPSCAANPDGGIGRYVLIGLMVAAPYVAATTVIRFIRKGESEMRAHQNPRPIEPATGAAR
jgi:hypothetical protein